MRLRKQYELEATVVGCRRGRAFRVLLCMLAGLGLAAAEAHAQSGPEPDDAMRLVQGAPFPFFGQPPPRQRQQAQRRARVSCAYPWSYSQGLGRCVCVRDGFSLSRGRCIENAAARAREVEPVRKTPAAPEAGAPVEVPKNVTPELVQRCLKEAGYFNDEIRDKMTPAAWTAFWFFKQDYDVGKTVDGIKNRRFQRAVFPLCPQTTGVAPSIATQAATDAEVQASAAQGEAGPAPGEDSARPQSPLRPVYAKPELECLPEDLYKLIVDTYGTRQDLKQCSQTCIAIPRDLSKAEIDDYETKRGITWCRSCIELGSYLPLDEILRIERGTNTQICPRPPSRLPRWGQHAATPQEPYAKVRAIYRAFRPAPEPGHRIAVVIGNRTYGHGLPLNAAAHNNAGAIYALLTEHLGLTSEDVIDLRDATLKEMREVFGGDGPDSLARRLQQRPDAHVIVYYAGHATTGADESESYLLPIDAVPYREAHTGYPLSELYDGLRRLNAKSTLLLLEASFGRDLGDFVFPPNLPEMQAHSLPSEPVPGLTVIAAASGDQKTIDDPEFGIGLFTRYLIEGLAGEADRPRIGNGDGKVEAVELYAFTAHMVRLAARKSYGLIQKPVISRQGNVVVSRLQPAR